MYAMTYKIDVVFRTNSPKSSLKYVCLSSVPLKPVSRFLSNLLYGHILTHIKSFFLYIYIFETYLANIQNCIYRKTILIIILLKVTHYLRFRTHH